LVYNRKLSPGSGEAIYGLEVCKAMDMDYEFLQDANAIRQEIMNVKQTIVANKVSAYNSNVIMDACGVCGNDAIDTHHIKFQCAADTDGMIDHIQKDSKANLVPLCETCHNNVHNNTLLISGYFQTSDGVKLDYKYITPEKRKTNRKYNHDQINTIESAITNYSKLNNKIICLKLQQDHGINISSTTLSKIKNGKY
jgi:hypothetical protein